MGGVFLLLSKISFYATTLILVILILVLSLKFNKKTEEKINNEVSNEYIASYFDGEYQTEIPEKDDGYVVEKIVCDYGATATWDNEEWGINIRDASQKIKCSIYFIKAEYDFGYSKTEQIFIVPKTGTYKIETWGAQGDDWSGLGGCSSDITTIQKVPGGQGGYSVGYIELSENQKLYVYVGKKGGNQNPTGLTSSGPGGGEATYILEKSGNLKDLENSISNIIVVSGGGGGSEWCGGQGGAGGGYIGNSGLRGTSFNATGGTQTTGGKSTGINSESETTEIYNGSFGQGGYTVGGDGGGQGGNGFYGGGASDFSYGGGGGSGYIGNTSLSNKAMYCYNCTESSEENTKTISTICEEETPTEKCAKKGNGYARITYIG